MYELISVIVPVYNLEKYIESTVISITEQKYKNIEIILVDDGSDDSTPDICDRLAAEYNNVFVVHKANGGVSSARNSGIEVAKGDLICFVDGDDYVTPTYISDLYDVLKESDSDISTCNHFQSFPNGSKKEVFDNGLPIGKYKILNGTESLAQLLYGKLCFGTCCCKLYKKEIFSDIRFPVYSMGEDAFTMYYCFLKASKVAHLHKPNYYYLQHEASAMHNENAAKFYDYVMLSDSFISLVNSKYPELYLPAVNRLIENNFWVYMKMRKEPERFKNELEHITANIKKYRKAAMLDKNVALRTRLACFLSYGGMKFLNLIYDIQK